ncbi:MAG: lipid asymmetry maintenance ABC transporter permease subunit MlaE [Pseudomonadota bacterium]
MLDSLVFLIQTIGQKTIHVIQLLGRSFILLLYTLLALPSLIGRFHLLVRQTYRIGVLSLSIILVSGLFVGMVLALQGYNTLVDFGAEESLGVMVALSLVRELGPVVGSLLFAGRAGSALTAEIGLMKATEQLSGMEMMAINPIKQILAPRLLAGIISLPLLVAIFSFMGVLGGSIIGVDLLGVDSGAFWSQIQEKVDMTDDILSGIIKSFVFAIVVTWIAIFEGYDCTPTSEGVSRATTNTVVYSSLSVFGMDFLLTAIML